MDTLHRSHTECIVYTWDYHTSASIWNTLRVLPILSDEIMTFKALILVHKVLQEGHKCALKEGQNQIGWLETCSRTLGSEGARGGAPWQPDTPIRKLIPDQSHRLLIAHQSIRKVHPGQVALPQEPQGVQRHVRIRGIYLAKRHRRSERRVLSTIFDCLLPC